MHRIYRTPCDPWFASKLRARIAPSSTRSVKLDAAASVAHSLARLWGGSAVKRIVTAAIVALSSYVLPASAEVDRARVDALSASVEPKVIAWRRDIHAHPE